MPTRRIRADRPLSVAERQARYRNRYGEMNNALWFIAERAASLDIARRVAADALQGHVDWTQYQQPGPYKRHAHLPDA
jgi:hypothetical protein